MKGGAEIAVQGMRMLLQKVCLHEDMKDYVCLSLDFKNAFNNVLRNVMLDLIKKHPAKIYPWAVLGYGEHSKLFYGSSVITLYLLHAILLLQTTLILLLIQYAYK